MEAEANNGGVEWETFDVEGDLDSELDPKCLQLWSLKFAAKFDQRRS